MHRWGQLFLLYFLSTAGLVASIFLLGDMTLFYEGMCIIGVILVTNIIVIVLQMHR
jgi:cytochrome c oxidase subunit IV